MNIQKCYAGVLISALSVMSCLSMEQQSITLLDAIWDNVGFAAKLIENGADLNAKDDYGYTPLHRAAFGGNQEIVSLLILKLGNNLNVGDDYGSTPLLLAVFNQHENIVSLLLEAGANPNIKNFIEEGPLGTALGLGNANIVSLLIKRGVKFEIHLLFREIIAGNEGMVSIILEGVDPDRANGANDAGNTPLHVAVLHNKAMVEILLHAGANPDVVNKDGESPFDIARKRNYPKIITLFEEASQRIRDNEVKKLYTTLILMVMKQKKQFPVPKDLLPKIVGYLPGVSPYSYLLTQLPKIPLDLNKIIKSCMSAIGLVFIQRK
jgi:ankyrin repeat protein